MSSISLPAAGVREAYLARHIACHQFKFDDPWGSQFLTDWSRRTHILLNKDDIILSQDSNIIMRTDAFLFGGDTMLTLRNHKATVTCMRLFPLQETSLFGNQMQNNKENFLVTSSRDNTIRLWWKGRSQRCFRGHSGAVTTLADRLLGNTGTTGKVLASGGEDGTVRLWSLSSSSQRGQHALRTFYGHEKQIAFLAVARHKDSLLVSISRDAKVRVWDATRSSFPHSSGCVGMTNASSGSKCREPVGIECHESLLYVATGSLVTAVDLRTMGNAFTCAVQPDIYSFQMLPSKFLICTGGNHKAMLWDIRKSQEKPKPVTEFDHAGLVSHLHMDPYKVVTGSSLCSDINVWDPITGMLLNSFKCYNAEDPNMSHGCAAMAVNGCRIVTASMDEGVGYICYKDYTHATSPISSSDGDADSKFWARQPYPDCDDSD